MKVKSFIYNFLKIFLISSLSFSSYDGDPFSDFEDLDNDEATIESTTSESKPSLHKYGYLLKSSCLFSEKNIATNSVAGLGKCTIPISPEFIFHDFKIIPNNWSNLVELFLFKKGSQTYSRRGPPSFA
jgi:hypothetical protein